MSDLWGVRKGIVMRFSFCGFCFLMKFSDLSVWCY